jgi:heme A synthase
MQTLRLNPRLINKILFAMLLLATLAVVAGSQLAPKVPLPMVLLYSAIVVLALGAMLVVALIVFATVAQWVLRKGGTDPQWFWFSGEPPGLQKLRAEARAQVHKDVA